MGFQREGPLKDKFAFFEAFTSPIAKRRELLAIFVSKKGPI